MVLPGLETLLRPEAYSTEGKSLVLTIPNKWKRFKHPNRTVNPQAFVNTAINSNIEVFFHTIYRALKLQHRPALGLM